MAYAFQVDGSETLEHYDQEGRREEPRPPVPRSDLVELIELYAVSMLARSNLMTATAELQETEPLSEESSRAYAAVLESADAWDHAALDLDVAMRRYVQAHPELLPKTSQP